MKIFIVCSKFNYKYIKEIKKALKLMNYDVILPNYYETPYIEEEIKGDKIKHQKFCEESFSISREKVKNCDATLVLNFDKIKDGKIYENYIGGATLLEMYDTYLERKPIFLYNEIPNNMLEDEIEGMSPIVINGNLFKIKEELEAKELTKKINSGKINM